MATRKTCDMNGTGGSGVVSIPNIREWGCEVITELDDEGAQADIAVEFYAAGDVAMRFKLTASNTFSDRVRRNPSPTNFYDRVLKDALVVPGAAYTAIAAAWRTAGTRAQRQKALADALLATGVVAKVGVNGIPAGQGLEGPTS